MDRTSFPIIAGQTLAQVSDRMVQLGLVWYITKEFGPNALIWYLLIGGLPHLLLVSVSSRVIQKLSSFKTILWTDLSRSLIYFCVFLLFWLSPDLSSQSVKLVLFSSLFLTNIFSAFFNPAILSLAVEIKSGEAIQKLTAYLTSITSLAAVVGPILGLFLYDSFGLNGLFIITSLSYLLSTLFFKFIQSQVNVESLKKDSSSVAAPELIDPNFSGGFLKTFSFLTSWPLVASMLIVFFFMNLFLSPIQVIMPNMSQQTLGNSFNSLAVLETALGLGLLLGGLFIGYLGISKRRLWWVWNFLILLSLSYGFFVSLPFWNPWFDGQLKPQSLLLAGGTLIAMMGFVLGLSNVLIINLLQTQTPSTEVPKVMSLVNLISTATVPVSLACVGILERFMTLNYLGLLVGALLIVTSLVAYSPFKIYGKQEFK